MPGVHGLRATAATNALEHEAVIAEVQQWLGHANTSTTHFYDRRQRRQVLPTAGRSARTWIEVAGSFVRLKIFQLPRQPRHAFYNPTAFIGKQSIELCMA